jgi:hypothetical protein
MFTESLCESSLDHHSRRSWTTLVSFGLQALAVSALLTLPFLSTQGLPPLSFAAHLMVPMREAAVQVQTQQAQSQGAASIVPVLLGPPATFRRESRNLTTAMRDRPTYLSRMPMARVLARLSG